MLNRDEIFLYFDRAIIACLCLLIFCLPFAKAGVESFAWSAIFIFILKRALGYRAGSLWGMFPRTELNKALGIFIAVNVLPVIFSVNLALSLRGFFGKVLKFLAIYFMLVEVINSKRRLKIVLIAIIFSAVLIVLDAGAQYFRGVDFLRGHELGWYSFGASFNTASDFSAWLIVIIPIFIGIIAANIIPDIKLKIFLFLSIIIQFLYLLKTYSRGAWVGFAVGSYLMFCYFVRSLILRVVILCLIAVIFLLPIFLPQSIKSRVSDMLYTNFNFVYTVVARVKSIPQISSGPNVIRAKLWKESLEMIKDYPLIGCGLNTYSVVARDYKSFDGGGIYPHNSYLQMAAETGLLGLFAFLWVLFSFFKMGLQHFNQKRDYLVLGLLSGILAFLVHAFFDTHLYSLQLVVLFWYMLGLTIAVIKLE
jgi:putative inorganic carbon (HCO3(-)) transporter